MFLYVACTLKGCICDLIAFTEIDIFFAYSRVVFGVCENFMPAPSMRGKTPPRMSDCPGTLLPLTVET